MTKLGDCKCIPKKDKEDLNFAIPVTKHHLEKYTNLAGMVTDQFRTVKKTSQDINDLEAKIENTPTCEDGDILKECTCFSDSEREAMRNVIFLFNSQIKKNRETLRRLRVIDDKIVKIPNRCKKFGIF